jgi:hypothetical protein
MLCGFLLRFQVRALTMVSGESNFVVKALPASGLACLSVYIKNALTSDLVYSHHLSGATSLLTKQ